MSLTTCSVAPPQRRSKALDTAIVSPANGVELLIVRDTRQSELSSLAGPAEAAWAAALPVTTNAADMTNVPSSANGFRDQRFINAPSRARFYLRPHRPVQRRTPEKVAAVAPPRTRRPAAMRRRDTGSSRQLPSDPSEPLAPLPPRESVIEPRLPVDGSVGSLGSGSTIAGVMTACTVACEAR